MPCNVSMTIIFRSKTLFWAAWYSIAYSPDTWYIASGWLGNCKGEQLLQHWHHQAENSSNSSIGNGSLHYCKSAITSHRNRNSYHFPNMGKIVRKMLAFVDGVHFRIKVEIPPNNKNQHLWSHEHAYDHKWDDNSEKLSWCDNSNGNLVVFHQIITFAKCFSTFTVFTAADRVNP